MKYFIICCIVAVFAYLGCLFGGWLFEYTKQQGVVISDRFFLFCDVGLPLTFGGVSGLICFHFWDFLKERKR